MSRWTASSRFQAKGWSCAWRSSCAYSTPMTSPSTTAEWCSTKSTAGAWRAASATSGAAYRGYVEAVLSVPVSISAWSVARQALGLAGDVGVNEAPYVLARQRFAWWLGSSCISLRVTPLVQPKPSCSGYSPPPACSVQGRSKYFSTSLPSLS
ncbi:hypothetical protein SAMN05421882_1001162 [Nitrosomonas communis]|uniref:Uncharacterized protein n=1 Tax=Nitrosomonas communis TaxID=44574 RepID=A0A1H2Q0C7_9PROT|nr:hypothetical protein SAMN05421882_1001162 [Nitrosomonas communis]